jgi:hypothetical protein
VNVVENLLLKLKRNEWAICLCGEASPFQDKDGRAGVFWFGYVGVREWQREKAGRYGR